MQTFGQTFDLAIVESLNGGDLRKAGNDLMIVRGYENQVYLAFFGGNVEEDTPLVIVQGNRKDFWGNSLFHPSEKDKQFNSQTERALKNAALTSAGRIVIENAAKEDVKFLSAVATVEVSVTIPKHNVVKIAVRAIYFSGERRLSIVTYEKRNVSGDFSIIDFNEDFF